MVGETKPASQVCQLVPNGGTPQWANLQTILKELQDTSTGLKYVKSGSKIEWNNTDITKEVDWMQEAFILQDYNKVGFIFGDVLYNNLNDSFK